MSIVILDMRSLVDCDAGHITDFHVFDRLYAKRTHSRRRY